MPLFEKARIPEKYDIAIMSTKGMSTTAARSLVDSLCHGDVPLFVLHDFDKSGFSIVGTLSRDTRRYTYANSVNVVDLGIRLADVSRYDLQSENCVLGKTHPGPNLRENGATEDEIEFLCSHRDYSGGYHGKRVELNAFSSGDFVEWVEGKLAEQGVKKVIPDNETIDKAYRRAVLAKLLNQELESFLEETEDKVAGMQLNPAQLVKNVKKRLKKRPEISWDQAVNDIAESHE